MAITLKQDYQSVSRLELDLFQEITSWAPRKSSTYYFELLSNLSRALKNKDPSCYKIASELANIQKCNKVYSAVGERLEDTIKLTNKKIQESGEKITTDLFVRIFEKSYNEISRKEERKLQGIAARMNNKYGPIMYEALSKANKSAKSDNITLERWIELYEGIWDSVIDRKNLQHN